MNTVNRTLLNLIIDEMSDTEQNSLLSGLIEKMDRDHSASLSEQASTIVRIKQGMTDRMDSYRNGNK